MKEFNDFLLKFKITNDKLKMEISLKDLVWLFHNSPENIADDGDSPFAKVRRGKRQEFAEYFVKPSWKMLHMKEIVSDGENLLRMHSEKLQRVE